MKRILYCDWITRTLVRLNPNKIFLFGDNLQKFGMGGQAAECRGEPNCIGIPTKKFPSMELSSFFTDGLFEDVIPYIDIAFNEIPKDVIVVIPTDGIGTGLAMLPTRAPKIYKYILNKIELLNE